MTQCSDMFVAKNENPIENQQITFALGADGEVATMEFLGQQFKKIKPKS